MPPFAGVAVKLTEDPEQMVLEGEAAMLTPAAPDAVTVTDKFWADPVQFAALVSVTETVPLADPNVTVIAFVVCPAVMLAPVGTVHT